VKAPVFQLAKTGTNNVMKDEREKNRKTGSQLILRIYIQLYFTKHVIAENTTN